MAIHWQIGPRVRCNLVAYAGINFNGKRRVAELFPSGSRKGGIDGMEIRSLVVRALPGTRVILCASDKPEWEAAAWRCIRVLPGSSVPSQQQSGLAGVRVPNLDLLDPYGAKKTDPEFESSYPYVDSLEVGTGWTFGRGGGLHNRIHRIIVEREDLASSGDEPDLEELVADVLRTLHEQSPAAVKAATDEVLARRGVEGLAAAGLRERLQEWLMG